MIPWIGEAYGRARIAVLRSSFEPSAAFPRRIAIEPASACNLECPMCPTWTKSRKNGVMSFPLFTKLVDEIAGHGVEKLFLHLWGEPLIHPRIGELLAYASGKPTIRETVMSTNATLLDAARSESILRSNLSCLVFSIDGASQATYETLRAGASFESTVSNVVAFLELRKASGGGPRVVFQIIEMKQTLGELEAFRRRWEPLLRAGDEISVKPYNNWAEHDGALPARGIPFRTPCLSFLWDFLAVTWDGAVLPCCYDCEGDLAVGDARENSLEEIWRGERMSRLQRAHLDLDFERFPLCAGCDQTKERLDSARLARMVGSRLLGRTATRGDSAR
jgi:radical SAM protein with 4Fe4S-binding SPASM domain